MGWLLYLITLSAVVGLRRRRGGGLTEPGRADRRRM